MEVHICVTWYAAVPAKRVSTWSSVAIVSERSCILYGLGILEVPLDTRSMFVGYGRFMVIFIKSCYSVF